MLTSSVFTRGTADGENADFLVCGHDQLAKRLAVSKRTVARRDADGRIPRPLRIAGCVRWSNDEISRLDRGTMSGSRSMGPDNQCDRRRGTPIMHSSPNGDDHESHPDENRMARLVKVLSDHVRACVPQSRVLTFNETRCGINGNTLGIRVTVQFPVGNDAGIYDHSGLLKRVGGVVEHQAPNDILIAGHLGGQSYELRLRCNPRAKDSAAS